MKRKHRYLLDFQKRLIRVATEMPRNDAMRLFAIIQGNLEEFISIRVPEEEDNIYAALKDVEEVYNLWAFAVMRKFPNLCANHEAVAVIGNAPITTQAITGSYMSADLGMTYNIVCEAMYSPIEDDQIDLVHFTIDNLSNELTNGTLFVDTHVLIRFGYIALMNFKAIEQNAGMESRQIALIRQNKYRQGVQEREMPNQRHDIDEPYYRTTMDRQDFYLYGKFLDAAKTKWPMMDESFLVRSPLIVDGKERTLVDVLEFMGIDTGRIGEQEYHFCITDFWSTIYRTDSDEKRGMCDNGELHLNTTPYLDFFYRMAQDLGEKAIFYVEPNARGDVKNNHAVANRLESMGAQVMYRADLPLPTAVDLPRKVHGKVMMLRCEPKNFNDFLPREDHQIPVLYVRIVSTGNFSLATAKGFRDLWYVTTRIEMESLEPHANPAEDVRPHFYEAFPAETGFFYSLAGADDTLPERPISLQNAPTLLAGSSLYEILDKATQSEMDHKFIYVKVNHLTDRKMIRMLVDAARFGIDVRVIVRTSCALPDWEDYRINQTTPKIQVRTIMGRYLEHDRVIITGYRDSFTGETFVEYAGIMSADMMERNLYERMEVVRKVDNDTAYLLRRYFEALFQTETNALMGFFNYPLPLWDR